jgi:hypothetical protein
MALRTVGRTRSTAASTEVSSLNGFVAAGVAGRSEAAASGTEATDGAPAGV